MFIPMFAFSQYAEVGLLVGASNYTGDVAHQTVVLEESQFAVGGIIRYHVSKSFAIRANIMYGKVSGDDANSDDDDRKYRNINFESTITEFSLVPEWYILGYDPNDFTYRFSPYVFAGVGFFKFNPKAEIDDKEVELRDLNTEGVVNSDGQDDLYKLTNFSIPFGVGVKYAMTPYFNIGMELGLRRTFTDYLDDVSGDYGDWFDLKSDDARSLAHRGWENEPVLDPNVENGEWANIYVNGKNVPENQIAGTQRGDDKEADWYHILGVTLTYNFIKPKHGCPTNF